jgi:hypothetical protein
MRNLLALAALALLTVVGVGWYLGWYKFQSTPEPDGHRQVTIDIDGGKVGRDIKKGEQKLHDVISSKGQQTPAAPQVPATSAVPPPPQTSTGALVPTGLNGTDVSDWTFPRQSEPAPVPLPPVEPVPPPPSY